MHQLDLSPPRLEALQSAPGGFFALDPIVLSPQLPIHLLSLYPPACELSRPHTDSVCFLRMPANGLPKSHYWARRSRSSSSVVTLGDRSGVATAIATVIYCLESLWCCRVEMVCDQASSAGPRKATQPNRYGQELCAESRSHLMVGMSRMGASTWRSRDRKDGLRGREGLKS